MKKLLALVLALVMVMGLSVSANAAFADAESIDHTEAVEVMNSLNIINGKENNNFDPDGLVKRSEMAKMVTIALLGDVDVSAFQGTATDLTDINGHWAEGYIKFCVSQGIVGGRGNGKFDPDATVTTSEASKMLLVALGYSSDVRGYTGDQWTINVARDAQQKGLYKDIANLTSNKAMDRDDAAQLIYNTLTATRVTRSESYDSEGVLRVTYADANAANADSKLLNKTFDAEKKVGYLTGIAFDTTKKIWTYTFTNAASFGGAQITTDAITPGKTLKSSTDYTDLFGQKVVAIYDDDDNSIVYGVYSNAKVLAEFATGGIGDIDNTTTTKIGGVKYTFDVASNVNNVWAFDKAAVVDTDLTTLKANTTAWSAKLIDNDDDEKVDAVVYTPMTLVKITYIGSETFTASTIGSNDLADFVTYDGMAKGDYAWYTAAANSKYDAAPILTKADVKTATVSGTRATPEYLLDGSWYGVGTGGAVAALSNNDSVEYVTFGNKLYYAKVAEAAATTKDVCVVISTENKVASGTAAAKLEGKLIFADGTKKTVTIAKVNGTAVTTAAAAKTAVGTDPGAAIGGNGISGVLFTYRVNSDGDYELTAVSATNLAGQKGFIGAAAADYNTKAISATGAAGGTELADDAVVFVWSGAAYGTAAGAAAETAKVYTGKEIKNTFPTTKITATNLANAVALTNVEDGFTYVKIAVLHNDTALTITTGSNYAYLTANSYESVENDKTYTNYTMWDGTSEKTVKEEVSGAAKSAGAIVTYDTTSTDGLVKNVTIVNATTGVITGWDGSSKIQLDGATSKVTSDTKLLFVNSDTKKGVAGDVGSIQLGNDTNDDDTPDQANVRYVGVNPDNVDLLVIDVNNDMKAAPAITIAGTATSSAAITAALSSSDSVTVTGAATVDSAIVIPAGKTLTFTGALTLSDDVTGTGTLVAATFADNATSTAHIKNSHVEITNAATKAEVVAIANTSTGNTLKLDEDTSDNVATADAFFATNGTAVNGAVAPAGTYTYYAANEETNASAAGNTAGWWTATAMAAWKLT